ncbi:MAG: hypothetical protein WDW38_010005 [Sanguina aurantia]
MHTNKWISSVDGTAPLGTLVGLHALVERKAGKQMFVKALCGEEMWDDSFTWLDGDQLRPRVQYVLSSGSTISIGSEQNRYRIEFEQPSAPNPMLEMMMQVRCGTAD